MLCYCWASESCSDGIQNQDETGVDCGGSVCSACARNFFVFVDLKSNKEY